MASVIWCHLETVPCSLDVFMQFNTNFYLACPNFQSSLYICIVTQLQVVVAIPSTTSSCTLNKSAKNDLGWRRRSAGVQKQKWIQHHLYQAHLGEEQQRSSDGSWDGFGLCTIIFFFFYVYSGVFFVIFLFSFSFNLYHQAHECDIMISACFLGLF